MSTKKQWRLVIVDGFYEWKTRGKIKMPVFIHLKACIQGFKKAISGDDKDSAIEVDKEDYS